MRADFWDNYGFISYFLRKFWIYSITQNHHCKLPNQIAVSDESPSANITFVVLASRMSTNMHCKLSFARECHGTTITAKRLFGHMRPSVECRKKKTWLIWILGIKICIIELRVPEFKKTQNHQSLTCGQSHNFWQQTFCCKYRTRTAVPLYYFIKNRQWNSISIWMDRKKGM